MKCIYKIENLINGKVYIGQTKDFNKRMINHKKASKYHSNSNHKYKLYEDTRLFGWENFLVTEIEYCEPSICDEREEYWIKYHMEKGEVYNLTSYAKFYEDPEIKRKSALVIIKSNMGKRKRVEQYDKKGKLLASYEGVREAGRLTGINHHTIQKVANKDPNRKTAGGYIWKYSEK